MDRNICIAVLGLGEMGTIHAESLRRLGGVELALASKRSEVLHELAERLYVPCALRFESYEDALASPRVDAVVVATAPADHTERIVRAAQAGKHIFCEKPLGLSAASVEKALAQVEHARLERGDFGKKVFMVGFMRRFDPAYARGKLLVQSGALGKPTVLKCTSGDAEYPAKYQRDLGYNSMLLDLAVHDIDLARWLLGAEVHRVHVVCRSLVYPQLAGLGDADNALALLEMDSGALVSAHFCRAFNYGYNVTSELVCERGSVYLGELKRPGDAVRVADPAGALSERIAPVFRERFEQAFQREMEVFAEAVRKGTLPAGAPGPLDGLAATRVAEALVRSWQTGSPQVVQH
jgi:predicted dehydrogenase